MKFSLFSILLLALSCSSPTSSEPTQSIKTDTIKNDENRFSELDKKYNLEKIRLPQGFKISVFAEVPGARSLALSPSGVLFIGTRGKKVFAVKDGKLFTIADDLNTPNGVAFKDGDLYVATISTILKFPAIEKNLATPPQPQTIYNKYPTDKHHGWKFIAFGPDGKLYVPVGAPCNICESKNPVYASITRINTDGSGFEIFAKGIRNTVGFDWDENGNLWFTDNGRDLMGDDVPNDELNEARTAGLHFGYPFCHQGNILDPEFGKNKNCSDYVSPKALLGPHVAALGMRFYKGTQFPQTYKRSIFIAQHGSWNRSQPIGYKVVNVNPYGSDSTKVIVFAEGWLQPDNNVLGRPVDVLETPDGSLLVSDDYADVVYKITYTGKK